ncbi:hypothetical protein SFRURICE_000502 [Spodoptera frugiperda]|nr:hypothetical protein SFRURICE_000502 [Spodoptera frugiperda]
MFRTHDSQTRDKNLWITQRVAPCGNRTRYMLRSSWLPAPVPIVLYSYQIRIIFAHIIRNNKCCCFMCTAVSQHYVPYPMAHIHRILYIVDALPGGCQYQINHIVTHFIPEGVGRGAHYSINSAPDPGIKSETPYLAVTLTTTRPTWQSYNTKVKFSFVDVTLFIPKL